MKLSPRLGSLLVSPWSLLVSAKRPCPWAWRAHHISCARSWMDAEGERPFAQSLSIPGLSELSRPSVPDERPSVVAKSLESGKRMWFIAPIIVTKLLRRAREDDEDGRGGLCSQWWWSCIVVVGCWLSLMLLLFLLSLRNAHRRRPLSCCNKQTTCPLTVANPKLLYAPSSIPSPIPW